MELLISYSLILIVICLFLITHYVHQSYRVVSDIRKQVADIRSIYYNVESTEELLSDSEFFSESNEAMPEHEFEVQEHVLQRDIEFSNRIARIKSELSTEHAVERKGTVADILHPDVENLPHDTIKETNNQPTEYAL